MSLCIAGDKLWLAVSILSSFVVALMKQPIRYALQEQNSNWCHNKLSISQCICTIVRIDWIKPKPNLPIKYKLSTGRPISYIAA